MRFMWGVLMAVALTDAAGAAVRIDFGRQLFVDDALVAETRGLTLHWSRSIKVEDPVRPIPD